MKPDRENKTGNKGKQANAKDTRRKDKLTWN